METKRSLLHCSMSRRLCPFSSTSNYSSPLDLHHPSFPLPLLGAQEICWFPASAGCFALPAPSRQVKFTGGTFTALSPLPANPFNQTTYHDNCSPVVNPSSRCSSHWTLISVIYLVIHLALRTRKLLPWSLWAPRHSLLLTNPASHPISYLMIFVWSTRSVFSFLPKL